MLPVVDLLIDGHRLPRLNRMDNGGGYDPPDFQLISSFACAVARRVQQPERAARLLGVASPLCAMLNEVDRRPFVDETTAMREQIGAQVFDRAHAEGRAMSVEQAIEYALENVE